jgi:hypothetical protein
MTEFNEANIIAYLNDKGGSTGIEEFFKHFGINVNEHFKWVGTLVGMIDKFVLTDAKSKVIKLKKTI